MPVPQIRLSHGSVLGNGKKQVRAVLGDDPLRAVSMAGKLVGAFVPFAEFVHLDFAIASNRGARKDQLRRLPGSAGDLHAGRVRQQMDVENIRRVSCTNDRTTHERISRFVVGRVHTPDPNAVYRFEAVYSQKGLAHVLSSLPL